MTSDEATPKPARRRRATASQPAATDTSVGPTEAGATMADLHPAIAEDGSAIQADLVEVRQAVVGRVDSERLEVVQGAVGGARAGTISLDRSALGGALAGQVSVRQSFARSILAREVRVEQSFVRMITAVEVRLERTTLVGVLAARKVVGDVRVLVDWRGALAFGAAFGLIAGLVRRGQGRRREEL